MSSTQRLSPERFGGRGGRSLVASRPAHSDHARDPDQAGALVVNDPATEQSAAVGEPGGSRARSQVEEQPPRRVAPILIGCALALVAGGIGGTALRLARQPDLTSAQGREQAIGAGRGGNHLSRPVDSRSPGTGRQAVSRTSDPPPSGPLPVDMSSPSRRAETMPMSSLATMEGRPPAASRLPISAAPSRMAQPDRRAGGESSGSAMVGPSRAAVGAAQTSAERRGAAPTARSPASKVLLSTTSPEAAVRRESAMELLGAARAHLSQDRLEAAIEVGRQALAAGRGAEARLVIGGALMKLRRTREAEREFASAAAEDPRHPLVQRRLEQARHRSQAESNAVVPPPLDLQRAALP